jgi:hypothetical protein
MGRCREFCWDGFSGESIRVFDVTEPDSPVELLGQIEQRKTGYET